MITMRSIARMMIPRVLLMRLTILTKSMANLPHGRRRLVVVLPRRRRVGHDSAAAVDARRTMALHSGCWCVSVPPCV